MGDKTYKNHDSAVKAMMKTKNMSMDRANAYVATIERNQKGKTKKKAKAK